MWAGELHSLDDSEIWKGINSCEMDCVYAGMQDKEAWPPSYAEFIGKCKGPLPYDEPDVAYGLLEIYLNQSEHRRNAKSLPPDIFHTYTKNMDSYRFKTCSDPQERRRMFYAAHKITIKHIQSGGELCEPREQKALPKPIVTPKAKKVGEKTIDSLKALF